MLFAEGSKIVIPYESVAKVDDRYLHGDKEVILGIRPEHIAITNEETGLKCAVNVIERLGNESLVYGVLSGEKEGESLTSEHQIIVKTVKDVTQVPGDFINLAIDLDNWEGIGNLPMYKMQVQARWLDDIVDNNKYRQDVINGVDPDDDM